MRTQPVERVVSASEPTVDLADLDIDVRAVAALPEVWARRHAVLPIAFRGERLVLAAADPNVVVLDDVRTLTGREVEVVQVGEEALRDAWERVDPTDLRDGSLLASQRELNDDAPSLRLAKADGPIPRAIDQIIARAVQQHASDIHVEPQAEDIRVRFRLDGALHEVMRYTRCAHAEVVSRIKVMAELDISERRFPQDGRMTVVLDGGRVDLRVTTVPSVKGEEIILRILDGSASALSLKELGFFPASMRTYQDALSRRYGATLVVGPTGSGKTTTLYSSLNFVNDDARKVITIEDPVELRLDGISQIHADSKNGVSFASALRSILRSDPDVVMVGEIRDTETARIAVQAAMTGHQVLSSLHTQDATSAVTRLIDMGVEPFLIATAVQCVLAQRLARRLCTRCRNPIDMSGAGELPAGTYYEPVGCSACADTGYRGRIALFELLTIDDTLQRMIFDRRSAEDIRNAALDNGMVALRDDALMKASSGVTSLDEVFNVTNDVRSGAA